MPVKATVAGWSVSVSAATFFTLLVSVYVPVEAPRATQPDSVGVYTPAAPSRCSSGILSGATRTTPLNARQTAVAATEIFIVFMDSPFAVTGQISIHTGRPPARPAVREYGWLPRGALCDWAHPVASGFDVAI